MLIGRRELKVSLRTKDPAEAKRLHAEVMRTFEAQIAAAWDRHRGQTRTLTTREADAIAEEWCRQEAAKLADDPGHAAHWEAYVDGLSDCFEPAADGMAARSLLPDKRMLAEADELLRTHGIAADSASVRLMAERWALARIRFGHAMQRRAEGDWSDDDGFATFPALASLRTPHGHNARRTGAV